MQDSKSTNIHWSISDVSEVKQQRPCGRHQTWYSLYAEWALQWPQCSATWKSETRSNGHISAGQYHQIPEKMFLLIDEIWWNIPLSLWTWCFQKDFSRIRDCIQCIPWISFNPDPRAFLARTFLLCQLHHAHWELGCSVSASPPDETALQAGWWPSFMKNLKGKDFLFANKHVTDEYHICVYMHVYLNTNLDTYGAI